MSGQERIDTLLLDIGEVLVGLNVEAALRRIAPHTPLAPEEIRARLGGHPLIVQYESGRMSTVEFHREVCQLIRLDLSLDRFTEVWARIFDFEKGGADRYVSRDFFHRLKRLFRIVALSNTNEMHFAHLRRALPLVLEFDDLVLSHEVGSVKPRREIFEAALAKTRREPDQLLFVDDLAENVGAAVALGIDGIVFRSQAQLEAELESKGLLR